MQPFEFLMIIVSIIVGLGITQLLSGVVRILRAELKGRKGFKLDLGLPSQVVGSRQPEFIHDLALIRAGVQSRWARRIHRLPRHGWFESKRNMSSS
jgi:hypothetical protein